MYVASPRGRRPRKTIHAVGQRRFRLIRSVAAVVMLAVVGAACGDSSADSSADESTTSADESAPNSGGTLTYALPQELPSFDPHSFAVPTNQSIFGPPAFAVFDALLVIDTKTFEVKPRLLQSFESNDGKVWTLTLQPELEFSDGTPLDAEAVKVNFERIANPETGSPQASIAQQIASMSVVDATTLEVTLKEANGFYPYAIADNMPFVVSPTQIANAPDTIATAPIGAGAFVLEEWARGSQYTFVQNPNYHDEVYLDGLIIKIIPDFSQVQTTMLTGGAQMGFFPQADQASQLAQSEDYTIDRSSGGGGFAVFFDMRRAPFDDIRARQAIIYALDQEAMSETVSQGTLDPASTMFPEDSPHFVEGTQQLEFDPTQAQNLFDELAADGTPLSFTLTVPAANQNQAEYIQAALSRYEDVTVEIAVVEVTELISRLHEGSYDAAVSGFTLAAPDPQLAISFSSDGGNNWTGYANATVDEAFTQGRAATDVAEQREQFDIAVKQIFEDAPMWLALRIQTAVAVNTSEVGGFTTFIRQTPDFATLWLRDA